MFDNLTAGPAIGLIFVVFFLLCCSFFFSGAETALTAASRARILQLQNNGDERAALVMRLLDMRELLISTLLICANLANTAAASLTTGILLSIFGEVGIVYATVVVSVLVIVFAEVLPKTLAILMPERGALFVAPAVDVILAIFGPLAKAIDVFVKRILLLFGAGPDAQGEALTGAEEIRGTVELLTKDGSVAMEDRHMLGGLLDLSDLTVSDIMVHRTKMTAIDGEKPIEQIIAAALESPYTRLPVYRGDTQNIVGILHAKSMVRAIHAAGGDFKKIAIDDLISTPWFVPDTTALRDQLKAFLKRRAHMALVVDEYGEVMGLISLEDIIEEIVGEIADETDEELAGVRVQADGAVSADGQVPIRDLNRKMNWALPDEEATTIAGLVIHEARMIPDPGQIFTFHGFTFQVLRKERNRITRLRITPTAQAKRPSTPLGEAVAAGG